MIYLIVMGSDCRKGILNALGGARGDVFLSVCNGAGTWLLTSTGSETLSGASTMSSSSSIRLQLVWQVGGTLSFGGGTVSVGCDNWNSKKSNRIDLVDGN